MCDEKPLEGFKQVYGMTCIIKDHFWLLCGELIWGMGKRRSKVTSQKVCWLFPLPSLPLTPFHYLPFSDPEGWQLQTASPGPLCWLLSGWVELRPWEALAGDERWEQGDEGTHYRCPPPISFLPRPGPVWGWVPAAPGAFTGTSPSLGCFLKLAPPLWLIVNS